MVNFFLKFSLESKDGKLLHNGERGKLVVEGAQDIPFEIKRVFYNKYMALTTRLSAESMRTRKANLFLSMLPGNQRCALQTESTSMLMSLTARCREFIFQKWSGKTCMIFRRTQFFLLLQARIMTEMNISATMMNI